jgi:hypothetical protein
MPPSSTFAVVQRTTQCNLLRAPNEAKEKEFINAKRQSSLFHHVKSVCIVGIAEREGRNRIAARIYQAKMTPKFGTSRRP